MSKQRKSSITAHIYFLSKHMCGSDCPHQHLNQERRPLVLSVRIQSWQFLMTWVPVVLWAHDALFHDSVADTVLNSSGEASRNCHACFSPCLTGHPAVIQEVQKPRRGEGFPEWPGGCSGDQFQLASRSRRSVHLDWTRSLFFNLLLQIGALS